MQRLQRRQLAQGASLLSIIAALSAAPVRAQDDVAVLGTIIITGEKVQRDMKDTASSVTVLSGSDIEKKLPGKDDVQTVLSGTPNVIYTDSVSTPIIRGQDAQGPHTGANAFFAGAVPRASINLDGHYLGNNEVYFGSTSVWDLDNIEVFRGPQTTSQGANAIAGAIVVNTRDPSFTPEGAWRIEAGNYGQRRASLMWSGPINEQLAARLTLDYSGRESFIDYIGTPTVPFVQNSIGQDFTNFTGRVKLLWQPADIDGLEVKFTYSHSEMTRPSAEGASPAYADLQSIAQYMPSWDQTTDTAIVDASYDLGNGLIFSNTLQTSRSKADRRIGVPTVGDADVDLWNYSNEAKLNFGTPEDQFSGVAGIYVAYTDQDESLNQGGMSYFKDRKHNLGVFTELSWRLDPQWTLTGGLRYQRDHIRRTGDVSPRFANSDVDYDHTFEKVLPKLSLAYAATPDITLGAMISKGYNPGGVSLDFSNTRDWTEFDAETVWNYELFGRASLLADRLFVTGNLFYMDYKNAQHPISGVINNIAYVQTVNAAKAISYGMELGVDYMPNDALTLNASAGLLHTEIKEFDQMPSWVGNEFARSPGKMFSLGASWAVNDQFTLGGKLRYVDGYYSNTANTAAFAIDGITLVDVNASYKMSDTIEVYGYVNNLFDERKPVLLEAARSATSFVQGSMTSPRMVGIGIRGTF